MEYLDHLKGTLVTAMSDVCSSAELNSSEEQNNFSGPIRENANEVSFSGPIKEHPTTDSEIRADNMTNASNLQETILDSYYRGPPAIEMIKPPSM